MLSSFQATIAASGFARPNRYRINITGKGPAAAGGNTEALYMMCESIAFPGQNMVSSSDTLRFGPLREVINGVSYGPINASFICSPDMREKRFFERWQEQTMDLTTWEPKYYSDYIGGMKIYQLDKDNAATYVVELFEVYPKTITEQSLGYATNDSYQTISVELEYHHWKYANERSPKKRRPRRGRTGGGAEEKDTTAYVDDAVAGLRTRIVCEAATTANLTTATDLQNGDTVDGVTLATGDDVLV